MSDHTNVALSLSPNRHIREQLRDSKAEATSLGAATNLQRVRATVRISRGFTLREPVDSQHSRRIPITELKNRRTFTLFTRYRSPMCLASTSHRQKLSSGAQRTWLLAFMVQMRVLTWRNWNESSSHKPCSYRSWHRSKAARMVSLVPKSYPILEHSLLCSWHAEYLVCDPQRWAVPGCIQNSDP